MNFSSVGKFLNDPVVIPSHIESAVRTLAVWAFFQYRVKVSSAGIMYPFFNEIPLFQLENVI